MDVWVEYELSSVALDSMPLISNVFMPISRTKNHTKPEAWLILRSGIGYIIVDYDFMS